jgi:cytochrome c oxidase subunit 3
MHERLAEQFDDLEQQHTAASLGMWIFLATEVLFFGGLLFSYVAYRVAYPIDFAKAGRELNITIGTINTAVLLVSSAFMAGAVHSARTGRNKRAARELALTWILGLLFLCLKAYEYYDDFEKNLVPASNVKQIAAREPITRLFYFIYYALTGLHAIHLTIALGIVAVIWRRARRGDFSAEYHSPVEVTGLYWHFVDLVWIFLYPLLYLMDRYS